jgi:hypothetical protein
MMVAPGSVRRSSCSAELPTPEEPPMMRMELRRGGGGGLARARARPPRDLERRWRSWRYSDEESSRVRGLRGARYGRGVLRPLVMAAEAVR